MTTYAAIAADINNALETFYYIKIGTTKNCPVARCDAQRLKLVWYAEISEKTALRMAGINFGASPHDYKPCGITESFGNFTTSFEAWEACRKFANSFFHYGSTSLLYSKAKITRRILKNGQ